MLSSSSNASRHARDEFEVAIRQFGHPSAVADLNSFSKKSASRRTFLDATFNLCRDNLMLYMQDAIMKKSAKNHSQETDPFEGEVRVDKNCPLIKAMEEYGMQASMLPEAVASRLREWLGTFGRPTPVKFMMLNQHMVRLQYSKQAEANKGDQAHIIQTSRNITKEHHVSDSFNWDKLKPVSIRDLKLFDAKAGAYLEGKLIIEPFTPMVGCTTILEDKNGDVLLIALYNFLPDGVSGSAADPIASAKIPKGCTVRIAEPFLKVFKDGSRGVRIDNPSEITVVLQDKERKQSLEKAKESGNQLFQKKMYLAATDCYISGLRKADIVPILLSNRSQAFIMMEDWKNAFSDAAASLTIHPGCKKTWGRYEKALSGLEQSLDETPSSLDKTRTLLEMALLAHDDVNVGEIKEDISDVNLLKSRGNDAYKSGNFAGAIEKYSVALGLGGNTCRALLSNWSQCCLNIGAVNDCLAGSAASLRISFDEKALYRLCKALLLLAEPMISLQIIGNMPSSSTKSSKISELENAAETISTAIASGQMRSPFTFTTISSDLQPYWYGSDDIETFDAGKKGRGVRAKVDMRMGQIVLIEHPIAFNEARVEDKKILLSVQDKTIEDTTQSLICETIIYRCQREGLLSNIINNLFDGVNTKPLVPFNELIPNILSTSPLLPSYHEYMGKGEKTTLTPMQVQGAVSKNSHGNREGEFTAGHRHTNLYPATSMFNHSKAPTCQYLAREESDKLIIVATTRSVKAGEELTVCYMLDEEKAKATWGIE